MAYGHAKDRIDPAGTWEDRFPDAPSTAIVLSLRRAPLGPEEVEERILDVRVVLPLPGIAVQTRGAEVLEDEKAAGRTFLWGIMEAGSLSAQVLPCAFE